MGKSSAAFVKELVGDQGVKENEPIVYLKDNEKWRFSVARVMLCGLLKNQFYRSKESMTDEAKAIFDLAARIDPSFLLKAAVFGRKGHMKGMVLLALATLNGVASDNFLTDNSGAFVSVLKTFAPNQLLQFVELCKSKKLGRGFGARPQRWVQKVMESWTDSKVEDYTLKYPKTMKTLVRLVHPSWKDNRGELIRYVLDKSPKFPNYGHENPFGAKQHQVEILKNKLNKSSLYNADVLEIEVATAMLENEIPWDVIKGFCPGYNTGKVGLATMTQMGLMALLLNMRSLESGCVFQNAAGLKALKMKLAEVKNGRTIPLDFAKPYVAVSSNNVRKALQEAIVDCLDQSLPEIEGSRVAVSVDVSGSMHGEALLTAGLLAVPFLKSKNLWFTTFSDDLHEEGDVNRSPWCGGRDACPVISGLPRDKQVANLLGLVTIGGTDCSAPLRKAIKDKRVVDLFVLITDEQQNSGTPIFSQWQQYKSKINKDAQLWVINASNYQWHSVEFDDDSVVVYQTMTPAIFKNLQYLGQDLVSAIEGTELKAS